MNNKNLILFHFIIDRKGESDHEKLHYHKVNNSYWLQNNHNMKMRLIRKL